ncbi:Gfo/Idh/MocA family oxidoreductase [Gryllotalpicola ginsengisoli]|uniref:Gfo/Idh/MocA family oxidoreductase n=1 Tax=Gryllotalpicola ginsengisoli TaxID=444608 RepID=UPI0003B61D7F|nr:Gfo/Idh/MocA family oxidoreductase [Gryllotalpicola ginsengisoli]
MSVRVGLAGYGQGGRFFHAPYIDAAHGCELAGVVSRDPDRARLARTDHPGVPVRGSLGELIDSGVDVVVLSTPPQTRRELALEAIGRGVHVVADKPFAPTVAGALELVDAAEAAGVILTVFHNRRWDTDLQTLKSVADQGELGALWRFDSRFDLDEPGTLEAGPTGGLLRDLGSHLVDQALFLFGPARFVSAQLDWLQLPEGRTDAGFVMSLEHAGGVHSHLSASKVNGLVSRELRLLGELGGYASAYRDVQAQAIFAGKRPADDRAGWGYEEPERWGILHTRGEHRTVPSAQGDYTVFYEQLAQAVTTGSPPPVDARDAAEVVRVLEAARVSAVEHRTVRLP